MIDFVDHFSQDLIFLSQTVAKSVFLAGGRLINRSILQLVFPLFRTLALGAVLAFAPGCLPNNQLSAAKLAKLGGSQSAQVVNSLEDLTSAPDDGAKGQCLLYDTSHPYRLICKDCYEAVLDGQCPGKSDVDQCSRTVRDSFSSIVNQCLSASIVAGFTCNRTCSVGQRLDPASCSCVESSSGSGQGTETEDVGQFDSGAPDITFRYSAIAPAPVSSLYPNQSGQKCTSQQKFVLEVRNRSATNPLKNLYAVADLEVDQHLFYGFDTPAAAPSPSLLNAENSVWFGASVSVNTNTQLVVDVESGGPSELFGPAALPLANVWGEEGRHQVLSNLAGKSGTPFPAPVPRPSGTPLTTHPDRPPGVSAMNAKWSDTLGMGARDQYGNLYFVDTGNDEVRVLCVDVATHQVNSKETNPNCVGMLAGFLYLAHWSYSDLKIDEPRAVAVDSVGNLVVTEKTQVTLLCKVIDGLCGAVGTTTVKSGLSDPRGVDLAPAGTNKIYFADTGNGTAGSSKIYYCPTISSCSILIDDSPGAGNLPGPVSDVKVTTAGNLILAIPGSHRIYAYCLAIDSTTGGFCDTSGVLPKLISIAGTGFAGDSAADVDRLSAQITRPYALALTKKYGSDNGTERFYDSHIAFVEEYDATSQSGNTVKILCGNSNSANHGLCLGSADKIRTLAGSSGVRIGGNFGNNKSAGDVRFAALRGITYDGYKNLVVSSAGTDRSIRAITFTVSSPLVGKKIRVTDSLGRSAHFCAQFQIQTSCWGTQCRCEAAPPLADPYDVDKYPVWLPIKPGDACPL